MSTIPKPQQPVTPAPVRPIAPAYRPTVKTAQPKKDQTFLFDKDNYILMTTGIALIFIGFMLMTGGKSANPHEFHYEEIYSVRRITIAPIVVLLGFVVERCSRS